MSTTTNLKYTKAIKAGRLKATAMEVGESVTGVLKGFKENQYGSQNIVLEVNGNDVEIFTAGNLKFVTQDVDAGKLSLDAFTVITRMDDRALSNGRTVTQFSTRQPTAATAAKSTSAAAASSTDVKAKLDAIRAKKASN